MAASCLLMLTALTLLIFNAGAVELDILEGMERNATVGSKVTFTCYLTSYNADEDPLVRWFFNGETLMICEHINNLTALSIHNHTHKACMLTIDPVVKSSGGSYMCRVTSLHQPSPTAITTTLKVIGAFPATFDNSSAERRDVSLQLLDPSTGAVLDEPEYGPVCVQSSTTRRFECRIQGARPAEVWDFTWILGTQTIAAESEARTTADGLVNVSSWHVVRNHGNGTRESNLTCLATSGDRSMNTTVLITVCAAGAMELDILEGTERDATVGSKVIFTCYLTTYDADEDPLVRWLFNGEILMTCGNNSLTELAIDNHTYKACILTIDPVVTSSGGLYECQALTLIHPNSKTKASRLNVIGGNGVLIAIATLVSVVTLVVTLATLMFFKCRRKRTEQLSVKTSDVRSSVEMDVASDLDDPAGQPGQSEVDRSPGVGFEKIIALLGLHNYEDTIAPQKSQEYENRITEQGPHQYQDTIAQQESQEYDDKIATRDTRRYEYKISQEVAYQDTTASQVEYDDTAPPLEEAPMPPDSEYGEKRLPPWAEGWVVPRCDVIIDERVLGRGNFGEVRSGGVVKDGLLIRAAIKMLKGHASTTEKDDFMDEFHTMTSIGHHRNVVSLIGACQHQGVMYVALEYLAHGDLRSYLRTARFESDTDQEALSSDQLVEFALNVAKGMQHIAKVGVIHRDLAARNILLSEELVAKVSDFGLSRGEDIYVQTSERRVPARWWAIESMTRQKYTTKSDVWSFGILLWEIATLGGTPYPATRSEALARKLKGGYRMPKPNNCDHKSYALMLKCWEEDPNNRPSFSDLVSILKDMDAQKVEHSYFLPDRLHYEDLSEIRPEFDDD